MKRNALSGKSIPALALGMLTLLNLLPLRAQDDATVKKDETAVVEQPADSTKQPVDANDENRGQAWRDGKDAVMIGNDFVLKEDEVVANVVVVSGNATIRGRVERDLVVVAGSANITGTVDGDVAVVLGTATLGPNAEVKRDVTVVGGTLTSEPTTKIGGEPVVVSTFGVFRNFEWLRAYTIHGLMLARPIAPQVAWVWVVAGICLFIYLVIALLFPRPIQACVEALEKRPVGSFFMGILLFVLFAPLTFLLAVSIVGIVVIPFLICAMVVAFLFGKVSVYRFAGAQLGKQFNLSTLQLPLVAFLIGALLFCLLYTIPVLGFLVWAAIIPFGMGAVVLAAFGGLRREGNGKGAAVVAAAPSVAPTGGAVAAFAVPPGLEPPLMRPSATPADFISMSRAGFWLRTFATIMDILLFVFVVIVTGPKALFLWFVYHVAMWAWKGTTVGGIVMGIKLVRVDGRPVDVGVALVRAAASIFSALILGLGFFWAGWNREKQSWHDKIAGTVMVKVPKGVALL